MKKLATLARKMERIWSKGFAIYSVSMVLLLVTTVMVTSTIQMGIQEVVKHSSDNVQTERRSGTYLESDSFDASVAVKNFDNVSDELFNRKVNELSDSQVSYILRSGYTLYIIHHYDHLGSETALAAQANGDAVFVEESNKTIWCQDSTPEGELSQFIDQFIEDQRAQLQKQ